MYSDNLRPPLKPQLTDTTDHCARAYLLAGRSTTQYTSHSSTNSKHGYVRLQAWETTTENGDFAIDLHFGNGTWEGGYIDLVGDEITNFLQTLATVEQDANSIPGQGMILFDNPPTIDQRSKPLLDPTENPEQELTLHVEPLPNTPDSGIRLNLGPQNAGVTVEATYAQRMDLLHTISTLHDKSRTALSNPTGNPYSRIGPDGTDTWHLGHTPELTN